MCSQLNGFAFDYKPFTEKRGNAVLSFPVCNCSKSLARIRSLYRDTVLSRAASEGLDSGKCPLAGPWLCGIYFLSRNMTSAGCELSLGSINTATFLGCYWSSCMPTAPSCRKERWSHSYTKTFPQESPSTHTKRNRSCCESSL